MSVLLLAGGTGGAKLARGMLDVVGPAELTVVANTGDDVDVHGVRVSPDPDLVTYWLADLIDERGWGIRGDTWEVMAALEAAGRPVWFRLGDRDLATCLVRTELLAEGGRATSAASAIARGLGVDAQVLPMSDDEVRTFVMSDGSWHPFQEFMIDRPPGAPVEGVELRGVESARPTPEVLAAVARASAVVVGPSNPIVSIGPILALAGMREALSAAPAPVVAVSPFVGGAVLKGPTAAFCRQAGLSTDARGIASAYAGVIDGLVSDEPADATGIPARQLDTLMDSPAARERVARMTLDFAGSLAGRSDSPSSSL